MSEERKEGVRKVWVSAENDIWTKEPAEWERKLYGPFHTAYLHDPPEGAPEPGERRVSSERAHVARHVHESFYGAWWVVCQSEDDGVHTAFPLGTWLRLPLAPPKPKYRLAAVDLDDEKRAAVYRFMDEAARNPSDGLASAARVLTSLLRIEEIPE